MMYVEWLRIRNVLVVLAIVLGVLIAGALITRIAFHRYITDDSAFLQHVRMAPGSIVTKVLLPNGVQRTTIDDPSEQTHVTIDNYGYSGRHIVVTEPRKSARRHHERMWIGSFQINESGNDKMKVTTIDTNNAVPFLYYMVVADVMALIAATILGAPFARENDGHLEFALMRPISRLAFGLRKIGVDIAGILGASLLTVIALAICQAMFEVPHYDFSGMNWHSIAIGIAAPLAWYAMLAAATASLRRGYGAILGFAWPVSLVVIVLSVASLGNSLIGQLAHGVFWTLSRLIPLSYASITAASPVVHGTPAPMHSDFGLRLSIVVALFVVYVALALYQWRRVEA